ncbi:response regulator transcription factor [Polynucleobacter kasalickyi]|uniref:Two-component response regulator, FixJ family, consists of REC and HTH domains n=1 Tax=Polynucleobacter kasalickyi TaxID=1938817 RepID=A0A1W2BGD8_9BURK|nr:response regulator [Polynucleobacter kasalickyi]SMC71508.1 Two-component response regulator, FixJ family, consists of REC and HTH domains [Polynucleobacter kasalickyi]
MTGNTQINSAPFSQAPAMNGHHVYLVEDDDAMRQILHSILSFCGYEVHAFQSAPAFLEQDHIETPAVVVTDMRMPGMSGTELQTELLARGRGLPVIFISGESTVEQSIIAMKQGAIEFLLKPFQRDDLIKAVARGIEKDIINTKELMNLEKLEQRLHSLTKREMEIYELLLNAYNNIELQEITGLKMNTIKDYKSKVMQKMDVTTLAELIQQRSKTF